MFCRHRAVHNADATHGTPRTQADVRRAILAMLNDPEWSNWSDREIAKRVGCSTPTVSKYRGEAICKDFTDSPRKAERNGTVYEVKTAKIGKTPKVVAESDEQPAEDGRPCRPRRGPHPRLLLRGNPVLRVQAGRAPASPRRPGEPFRVRGSWRGRVRDQTERRDGEMAVRSKQGEPATRQRHRLPGRSTPVSAGGFPCR